MLFVLLILHSLLDLRRLLCPHVRNKYVPITDTSRTWQECTGLIKWWQMLFVEVPINGSNGLSCWFWPSRPRQIPHYACCVGVIQWDRPGATRWSASCVWYNDMSVHFQEVRGANVYCGGAVSLFGALDWSGSWSNCVVATWPWWVHPKEDAVMTSKNVPLCVC